MKILLYHPDIKRVFEMIFTIKILHFLILIVSEHKTDYIIDIF
jgi:hypothetical protein